MKHLLLFLILLSGTITVTAQDVPLPPSSPVKYCVNMGNTLEAPNEGEWGFVIQEEYFALLADAGFDSVRLPVRWSAHTAESAPYTIDPAFFERIDEVIGPSGTPDRHLAADRRPLRRLSPGIDLRSAQRAE